MKLSSIVDINRKLQESRRDTLNLINNLEEQAAVYRMRPDAWCVKDHIIHLATVEEAVIHFAYRILNEDCPISHLYYDLSFDQDTWNNRTVARWTDYSWAEVCNILNEIRTSLVTLLNQIPVSALNRVGSHPVWGEPVTLASVLRVPYRHERAHRNEVAALIVERL